MEFLVTMTTHVPDGTSEAAVDDIRAREAAHSRELAAQRHLLRLWRPPLSPGEWRTLGLFDAEDPAALDVVLRSMPLRVWRSDNVQPLLPHPNDPGRTATVHEFSGPGGGNEFLTEFGLAIPPGTPSGRMESATAAEAVRAHELAAQGQLLRLWTLTGEGRMLGLWQAHDREEREAILASLPLSAWMHVETTQLFAHPNDPGLVDA
jgi:muconolactone delta-isomerase